MNDTNIKAFEHIRLMETGFEISMSSLRFTLPSASHFNKALFEYQQSGGPAPIHEIRIRAWESTF